MSLYLRVPLPVELPELMTYVQLESKVTFRGVPDVPDDGDAEHSVTVHVNGGAPGSATVTSMVTVTVTRAAWTGMDGRANRTASRAAVASKTPPSRDCKRPGRRLKYVAERYLVLRTRTTRWSWGWSLVEQHLLLTPIWGGKTPVTSTSISPSRLIVRIPPAATRRTSGA